MKYLVKFYADSKVLFSKEIFTDNLFKLTEYINLTTNFLEKKHQTLFVNYEISRIYA